MQCFNFSYFSQHCCVWCWFERHTGHMFDFISSSKKVEHEDKEERAHCGAHVAGVPVVFS